MAGRLPGHEQLGPLAICDKEFLIIDKIGGSNVAGRRQLAEVTSLTWKLRPSLGLESPAAEEKAELDRELAHTLQVSILILR